MQRSIHARPGLGAVLQVVQEGGIPLRRVLVDFPSLILVQSGRKTVRTGKISVTAGPGEMLAVASGSEIEVTNALPPSGPYEAFCLSFDPRVLAGRPSVSSKARVLSWAEAIERPPGYLRSAFQRAVASCQQPTESPEGILRHQLEEVLLGLELVGWAFDPRSGTRISERVRQTLGSDPSKRWKAAEVGRLLGMSEATLRRRLDEEGTGFRAIMAQVRMGRALVLLQASDRTVTQVAADVGYESASQFTARFRKHFGQSPRQLRERGGKA